VSLEDAFGDALKLIAATRNIGLSDLVTTINKKRRHANLSSMLRVFVLDHYLAQADGRNSAKRHKDETGRPTARKAAMGRTGQVDLKRSLAINLRRLRVARGLSQTELAAAAGIARDGAVTVE
jgi:predicted DNA-binding ribbon-helix-helix protein